MNFKDGTKLHNDKVVNTLYICCMVALIPLVIAFFYLRSKSSLDVLITGGYFCSFRRMTGLYCPGCGGTRAAIYLARFHIVDSFKMNAAVPVGAALYIIFVFIESLSRVFHFRGFKEKHMYVMIGIFVITVIIRWIIVNSMILGGRL